MNNKQKAIVEKIINGEEKDFTIELLDHFLDRGLGSVSKSETDIFLFYILDKYQKEKGLKYSNFELSSLFKISERKIKNLRLEVGIRYHSDLDIDEFSSFVNILNLVTEGYLEFKADELVIGVEDPYLSRFIVGKLKEKKLPYVDYNLNREKLTIKVESFEVIVKDAAAKVVGSTNQAKAIDILKKAKWLNNGKVTGKKIYGIFEKSLPMLMKSLTSPF